MVRITVVLEGEERDALCRLANQERRRLHSQAALLIHQELERRGLLKPTAIGDPKYCNGANQKSPSREI